MTHTNEKQCCRLCLGVEVKVINPNLEGVIVKQNVCVNPTCPCHEDKGDKGGGGGGHSISVYKLLDDSGEYDSTPEWELEFDEKFPVFKGRAFTKDTAYLLKDFFRHKIQVAEERGAQKADWWGEKLVQAEISGVRRGRAATIAEIIEKLPHGNAQDFVGHQCQCGNSIFCSQWNTYRTAVLELLNNLRKGE